MQVSQLTPRTYAAYLASVGPGGHGHSAGSEQDLLKFGQLPAGGRFSSMQTIHSGEQGHWEFWCHAKLIKSKQTELNICISAIFHCHMDLIDNRCIYLRKIFDP